MKKCLPFLFLCLLLTGCAALLERSYSIAEPYSDRYWDSTAEDTLRAENHQDLVNSLLMLVEERAEEGTIRCYGAANSYLQAQSACREVSEETALGSYLLSGLTFDYENSAGYSSLTCRMSYREDAEDPSSLMTLSDSQSLVDLLRLAVREEHEKITACFTYNTPREAVTAAVESYWQELCREEMAVEAASGLPEDVPDGPSETLSPEDGSEDGPEAGPEDPPEDAPAPEELPEAAPEDPDPAPEEPEGGETPPEPPEDGEEDSIEYPPCPWAVRFYPNQETAELVEILLRKPREGL